MKKILSLVLLFSLGLTLGAGCVTEPEPASFRTIIERTKVNFASVNEKIFDQADVMFDHKYNTITMKDYDQFFTQYRFPKAVELREDLEHFDQREIYTFDKTFIACIHLTKANYTICDDPRCGGVEKAAKGGKETVERWLRELPWEKCPRSPNNGISY